MPKPGVEIGDVKGPHSGQVLTPGGHVHFYWIKGGWIFRAAGMAYARENLFNALIYKNQPVDGVGLGIAAGLFARGEVLKHTYRPYFKLGKKYSLSTG